MVTGSVMPVSAAISNIRPHYLVASNYNLDEASQTVTLDKIHSTLIGNTKTINLKKVWPENLEAKLFLT